jgi:hypothetical protein
LARFFKDNGLSIALLALFAFSIAGQLVSGWKVENEELQRHGGTAIGILAYLKNPAFASSVFENWESEFLQMAAYVVLTAFLFQKGSAESQDPDAPERPRDNPKTATWLYAHSLGIALFALFLMSFAMHWINSAKVAAQEARDHGEQALSAIQYLGDPQLWFESFQNWQSEFLSTAVLVLLSIYLRQKGSPESKPVGARNDETGA